MYHSDSKPKIFHGLVNYGTQSGLLANELRSNGFDALSVTFYDKFKRQTDVELKHGGSILEKIYNRIWNYQFLIKCFFKFDIFHFYYGHTLMPNQRDLPFYRIFGKKVVMEYLGNDIQGYKESIDKYRFTNVKFMMTEEEGFVYDYRIKKRFANEIKYCNKLIVCAPYLYEFSESATVLPLAVDISRIEFTAFPNNKDSIRIMHAPTHRGFKGTDFIERAIQRLISEGYNIQFDLVENVTHEELLNRYKLCHLFIDQIMAGWYGTATIEAMAIGRPVIVSTRREYFEFFEYSDEVPTINADPDIIYDVLRETLDNGFEFLEIIGKKSREFVEQVHDVKIVTDKLITLYDKL